MQTATKTTPVFNFMVQSDEVEKLLLQAQALVERLPAEETENLVTAMRVFEKYGVPTLWSPDDADPDGSLGLTEDEKRSVICNFIDGYERAEDDWLVIKNIGNLVRSGRRKSDQFTLNATGNEVTDSQTGLIWKRSVEGQAWDGQTPQGEPAKFTWDEAMAYAAAQPDGWRLPTIEELKALFEGGKPDEDLFLGHEGVWISSPGASYPDYAWVAFFRYGDHYWSSKDSNFSVRLVRGQ